MLQKMISLVCLLLCLSPVSAGTQKVLVLGDSLSSGYGIDLNDGWVAKLAERLNSEFSGYEVVNASVAGDTTLNGLTRLDGLLTQHHPDYLIVQLGGNDGLRGLNVKAIRNNLSDIIDAARRSGVEVLLLGIRMPPNYGPEYARQFERMYADLALEHNIKYHPFILEGVVFEQGYMQQDSIHPTAEAQQQILENVWSVLQPMVN